MIKKADILLAIALLLLCAGTYSLSANQPAGELVTISIDSSIYGTYPLNKDQTILIRQKGHQNTVKIKNGQVQMLQSDCKNQLCVHQGGIRKSSQTIVCLPNHLIVSIDGQSKLDGISY